MFGWTPAPPIPCGPAENGILSAAVDWPDIDN